jgi:hypothetical protein
MNGLFLPVDLRVVLLQPVEPNYDVALPGIHYRKREYFGDKPVIGP